MEGMPCPTFPCPTFRGSRARVGHGGTKVTLSLATLDSESRTWSGDWESKEQAKGLIIGVRGGGSPRELPEMRYE